MLDAAGSAPAITIGAEAARIADALRTALDHRPAGSLRSEADGALRAYLRILALAATSGTGSFRHFRRRAYVLAALLMMNDDKESFDLANDLLTLIERCPAETA